jgi:hypothetical protein
MDCYRVLNINYTTDYNIIRKAYYNLVKKYHPDRMCYRDNLVKSNNNIQSNKIYQINQAYHTLITKKNIKIFYKHKIINCYYNPEQLLVNENTVSLQFRILDKNYVYYYNLTNPINNIKLLDYQIKINCYQDNSNNFYHLNNNIINILHIKLLPFINGFNYDLILKSITLRIFFEKPYLTPIIHINNHLLNKNINFYIFIKLIPPTKSDLVNFKIIKNVKQDKYIIYS